VHFGTVAVDNQVGDGDERKAVAAKSRSSGSLAMESSSLTTSAIAPIGRSPAIRSRSTATSV
jgi:hypothetical protein